MKRSTRIVALYLAAILAPRSGTLLNRLRLLGASAFAVVGVFVIGVGAASAQLLESTMKSAKRRFSSSRTCLARIAANFSSVISSAVRTGTRGLLGIVAARDGESARTSEGIAEGRIINGWNRTVAHLLAAILSLAGTSIHRLRTLAASGPAVVGAFVIGFGAASLRLLVSIRKSVKRRLSSSWTWLAGLAANFSSVMPVRDRLRARWTSAGAVTTGLRGLLGIAAAQDGERTRSKGGIRDGRVMIGSNRTVTNDLAAVLPPGTPFQRLRLLAASAFAVVGVFVIGFGVWATYAPLESAAVAGGAIEAESSRKTIQHLEGGIVGRILVNDGDEVTAGQPLIGLDDTKARATVQVLQMQLWDAQALEARLLAERGARETIQFPLTLRPAPQNEPALAEIIAGQTKIFDTRRKLQASRIEIIQRRKAQTEQEIAGLRFQAGAATKRAAIIKKEVAVVAPLVAKGLQTRGRLTQLEREQAEIDGRLGDTLAQISRAEQSIGESQAMILKLESDHHTEIAQDLRDTRAQIFQLLERIQAASDVLARTVVRAPEAGTITDLRIHTPGGVVAAGEPLVDLVPSQDRLIVRAQVKPEDIDLVRPGLVARVRLLAYKHRRVPPVEGVLTYVSADRLVDKETEQAYYAASVRIDEASLRELPEVEITPGMPVEVLIKTGQFTVAHYVLRPVLDSFNRAFRED